MRFSIRDLIWATVVVVVAMGLGWGMHYQGWCASYRALDARRIEAVEQSHRHRAVLGIARDATKKHQDQLLWIMDALDSNSVRLDNEARQRLERFEAVPVDYRVLDEQLVEP